MNATSNGRVTSSRPLTICKIWDADYPWDIRIEKISESLVAAGHTVHLVCRNAERRPRREAHGRFVIHRLPAIPRLLGPAHALCNFPHPISPVWTKVIWRVARETHADVILVRDLPLAIPAALVGRWLSVPVVLDMAEHYARCCQIASATRRPTCSTASCDNWRGSSSGGPSGWWTA
jgi:hypothetical protein